MLHGTNKSLQTNKGRRSAERRILRDRSAQSERCRWAGSRRAPLLGDALAFRRSTAALADCSAQSGPALHGSANGCHSVRHPGSQLLADRRRGRPGEFPNRPRNEVTSPIPGTAPAPLQGSSREASPVIGEQDEAFVSENETKCQEQSDHPPRRNFRSERHRRGRAAPDESPALEICYDGPGAAMSGLAGLIWVAAASGHLQPAARRSAHKTPSPVGVGRSPGPIQMTYRRRCLRPTIPGRPAPSAPPL